MAATVQAIQGAEPADWDDAAKAMFRAAQAVAQAGGPNLFADLVRELADTLRVATAFVAVFSDETHQQMRTLGAVLDGRVLQNFDYPLEGTPCAKVVGRAFRHVPHGVAVEFPPGSLFGAKGMDSYAAFPLTDSAGTPLGLLVAMDRQSIADAELAEALLKIFAGRMVAEIERSHVDEALRAAALAVSSTRGDSVFAELVRLLAAILHVEVAFIARVEPDDPQSLRMLAMQVDRQMLQDMRYAVQGTPCEAVLGQRFRVYPDRLHELFPDDTDAEFEGIVSYAGYPLLGQDGTPLGTVAIASRAPLVHVERIESVLQIFAVRAAAEIEQLRATEALRRSEASYRAIFETTEDAIFVHDWDSGAILDANPKACANYGYSRDELLRLSVGELSSGVPPYTQEQALRNIGLAKLDRCPPFEWHRRSRDGSLHWDEVRLKPLQIDGRPHILAITREITQHKAALEALQAREEQYRVIFDGSADALVLWDPDIRCVDVNQAFTRLFGWERAEAIGGTFPRRFGDEAIRMRVECIRAALQGQERLLETQAVRKDGSRFDVEVRYLPIRYGGVPHVLSIGRDITERKAALAALQAREEQYRAIFDGSADSMGLWSEELVLADVNQAFTRLSGWTRDEVVGRRLDERAGEPDAAQRIELIRGALAGREGRVEARVPSKDGPAYDVEIRYVPVSFGGRAYALSVARDITERNVALAALRAQEQKYRTIFDSTVDSMVLWDRELRVVDVNDAFVRMTGLAREQVIGRHWSERPDADDLPQMLELIEGALDGRADGATLNVSRVDGSRFDIELRYLPVRFGDEAFALGVGRDVSERLEQERRLRDSEEQYRSIFNASADALVLRDAEFRIVDVNATYERMSGYGRDEVLGIDRIIANPAEVAPAIRAQHERALAGEPVELEVPFLRKDGLRYEIELRGMPVRHRGAPHVLYMGRDVTERKRAEAALRASEEQYRAIFDASIDALILWNSRYQRVDVNPAFERIFGWSRDEVLDRGYEQPSARTLPRRELVRRALAGEVCNAELDIARKDGTSVHVEVHVVPFQHRGEAHALAIVRDITERKTAEAQLRASEEQYREIFNASADALMLWNGRLQRVDVNPAHEKIFGFRRDEVVGRGFEGLPYPEEFARPRLDAVRRALAGEASRAELEAIRKDGRRIVTELRTIPFTQRGEPLVLQIARDITESRTAEARLRASEAQYRAIFDASIDALILWNSRYERVDVNPAYERIFGWSRDEVVGCSVDGPNPDPDSSHTRRELVQRALAGEACSAEREAVRKDGTRILIEVHAIPFRHRGEAHVLAIARDITERRAAEVQRERLEAQLRQAQKMEAIGQLTGGIAHDFNNILTSVIGYLVLGQERAGTLGDERLQRQLDKAQLAAQRARELIAQMLAFARRQRGERRVLPLAPLVRQTLQLLRSTLPASVAVNALLPDDAAGPCVEADAVQLEQVLFNLCLNARDAIDASGLIKVRLRECSGSFTCASCRAQLPLASWVELSVADNGSGIAAGTLERMFEPFFSTKEVGRGSGMGLAMVHGIVHDHGGHVVVETEPQAGSVFRVLLPPAQAEPQSEPAAVAQAPAARPLQARVMVVDDEAMVGDFMAELLDGWGLEVVLQRDPLQALAWLEHSDQALDLLITDQTMPQLSGLQLAQRAGTLRPGLPVLLYTGNAEGIDAEEAKRHGVCGVLRKPVDAEALQALMQRCLSKAVAGTA
ncbi:MAG: histidine kinase [Proteobacteria bacterium]|nr:histidine kinase [Pseudomonadota bacterium]